MNFIDKAMEEKAQMSPDDFLQAMADIYKEPEVWKILDQYPQFIQDVIYIIDYDTDHFEKMSVLENKTAL